jgi:hypothetical protein
MTIVSGVIRPRGHRRSGDESGDADACGVSTKAMSEASEHEGRCRVMEVIAGFTVRS